MSGRMGVIKKKKWEGNAALSKKKRRTKAAKMQWCLGGSHWGKTQTGTEPSGIKIHTKIIWCTGFISSICWVTKRPSIQFFFSFFLKRLGNKRSFQCSLSLKGTWVNVVQFDQTHTCRHCFYSSIQTSAELQRRINNKLQGQEINLFYVSVPQLLFSVELIGRFSVSQLLLIFILNRKWADKNCRITLPENFLMSM